MLASYKKKGEGIRSSPESVFLDEALRAGVGVDFFAEFLTNEKVPRH